MRILEHLGQKMYKNYLKRAMDIVSASFALILFLPLMIVIMFSLWLINNREVFFRQERPGKGGVLFNVMKFKTMNNKVDSFGQLCPDDVRLTSVGKLMRSFSLDELPQLINVIRGDMSLVGPRPLLREYLPLYSTTENRRHAVRPGITGWAQVNGRNAIGWEEKFKLDVWYVDHVSFALDVRIIFLTLIKVLRRSDVSSSSSVTMEKFKGNTT